MLYAPRRSYLATISCELKESLKSSEQSELKTAMLEKLKSRKYIDIEKLFEEAQGAHPILSIAITEDCNLRCTYCYASAGESHRHGTMSCDMIDALLSAYFAETKTMIAGQSFKTNHIEIRMMGGGEPTRQFEKLQFLVRRANEMAAKQSLVCRYSLATNGAYGDNVREFLVKNVQNISLSFDGPAHIQNMHRPIANGKDSFPMVFGTAQYFFAKKAPFALRATVSDYSLKYLQEVVDFFATHFPRVSISLEPLVPVGRATRNKIVGPPDKKLFADELVKLLQYASERTIQIVNTSSSEYDILRPVFCSSVAVPNWTVMVNGNIFCCERDNAPDDFRLGKFDFDKQRFALDPQKIERIRKMNVFNYEECLECFCKYHCAGDCPDRRLSDKSDCNAIRKIGTFMLANKLERN